MTKTELNKYKALLEARQAELAGGLRNREGIAIEKAADALDEVQLAVERELAISNLDRVTHIPQKMRIGDQPEAFGRRALDCLLHPLPGSRRPRRVRHGIRQQPARRR